MIFTKGKLNRTPQSVPIIENFLGFYPDKNNKPCVARVLRRKKVTPDPLGARQICFNNLKPFRMTKKLSGQNRIKRLSVAKVAGLALLFSIFLASCNDRSGAKKKEETASASISHETSPGESSSVFVNEPAVFINWLTHWDTVHFDADPADSVEIKEEMKKIRAYVRGWLVEYNDSIRGQNKS
jgi:hypothetical protein